MSSLQQYLDLYRDAQHLIDQHSCAVLNERRKEAAQLLQDRQLPNTKVERYKYTNADAAFAPDFGINIKRLLGGAQAEKLCKCSVSGLPTYALYVVNDVVMPMSEEEQLPEGVTVLSFAQAAAQCPELLDKYYHKAAQQEPANAHKNVQRTEYDAVTLLNTLLVQDGILVHLAAGAKLDKALQIVFHTQSNQPIMANRRLLVVAEADSFADILICEHAKGQKDSLSTQVTEVYLGEKAAVSIYNLEETREGHSRFSNIYVEQQQESRFSLNNLALTTGLSRTMTNARLLGEGADCQTAGMAITDGKQHVDNTLLVDHVAENCTSDMMYKYVLDGDSTAVFAGKVMVRPDAQKTLSQQNSANICLSPTAHVHALPMLEIYADDVRCNHGATIGKLDEGALLYLRQRGIPLAVAKLLLQHAFVNDVLQRIPIEALRERLSHLVELRFRGELHHCQDCHC